jgi:hypothetical protein
MHELFPAETVVQLTNNSQSRKEIFPLFIAAWTLATRSVADEGR